MPSAQRSRWHGGRYAWAKVATIGFARRLLGVSASWRETEECHYEVSLRALVVCLAGALYTNLFEHIWHRYAMHGRRPDPRHATHHRLFYGERFQTSMRRHYERSLRAGTSSRCY